MKNLDSTNRFDVQYLLTAYKFYGDKEHFFINSNFFDKLAGTNLLRKQIMSGVSEEVIRQSWQKPLEQFKIVREKYLLYE